MFHRRRRLLPYKSSQVVEVKSRVMVMEELVEEIDPIVVADPRRLKTSFSEISPWVVSHIFILAKKKPLRFSLFDRLFPEMESVIDITVFFEEREWGTPVKPGEPLELSAINRIEIEPKEKEFTELGNQIADKLAKFGKVHLIRRR